MTWSGAANAAIMTVTGADGAPTLAEAAHQLGLDVGACDPDFGVVVIDPDRKLYGIRVDTAKITGDFEVGHGPFSDPVIAPFGPDPKQGPKK
jgi:hypothetical protein